MTQSSHINSELLVAEEPKSYVANNLGQIKQNGDEIGRPWTQSNNEDSKQTECGVISNVDRNYLTPIDVVVKDEEKNIACIRAKFALSIKVEETSQILIESNEEESQANLTNSGQGRFKEVRTVLGYLLLENVLHVEDTCPGEIEEQDDKEGQDREQKQQNTTTLDSDLVLIDPNELEMIVTFECGKLSFSFRRDEDKYFMSSIKGMVKLDKKVKREFIAKGPMFLTSDLTHRFKYDELIEVASEAQTKAYILTANFYSTEIEVFRKTASIDFTRPPDESSRPFPACE